MTCPHVFYRFSLSLSLRWGLRVLKEPMTFLVLILYRESLLFFLLPQDVKLLQLKFEQLLDLKLPLHYYDHQHTGKVGRIRDKT